MRTCGRIAVSVSANSKENLTQKPAYWISDLVGPALNGDTEYTRLACLLVVGKNIHTKA